ncbi:MAG: HlyD family efflux transporter periplasmic adaptor subunit [Gammaproteobacteria bacterium]|jgi:hypothetical protein|nr:HlyD family efflux transporter periplasmic adaptor subunit [Gammaproteobacteria bacterium]MBT4378865.1 HlyD family efflux transporter periplasmic adaptor subunit [Gammaproteobacteria bacterium]MBT4618358.1 HlyD family efflux transporter periplasmic adaptor subunit [Gammaproteobacteria bacterium]MBT5443137.1 HlyD family efflux transporter periplasmic adaptor subunit [Gammaproteobacteria bacterium]MBT5792210.1 HlyD family efflux transporter periplasmic adaptor subunit [Gammaproteobacteria bact
MTELVQRQLQGLSTLVQLERQVRGAEDLAQFGFLLTNETRQLLDYRQAVLWLAVSEKVQAVSGLPFPDPEAPFVLWLTRLLRHLCHDESAGPVSSPRALTAADLPEELAAQWQEWLPAHVLLIPLINPASKQQVGILLLAREPMWLEQEQRMAGFLGDSYGHSLSAHLVGRRDWRQWKSRLQERRTWLWSALALVMLLLLPVRQSVLAPAEVVPWQPEVVRAPLDGVVDSFAVGPNDTVIEGQLLLRLDDGKLRNQLRETGQALAVAQAEYRQARQKALRDQKSKAKLTQLRGVIEQHQAKLEYVKSLLQRIDIRASRDGIAVFASAEDWIGRPVALGERILTVAAPENVELQAWLPVSDAITLQRDSDVRLFLNIRPTDPLEGKLRLASYQAEVTPEGILAYRLRAGFNADEMPPRIGLRGTAKIYGTQVSLFYYLMRRPLAAARQWLGI